MSQGSRGFDWAAMLKLAVCQVGMRPADFWSLTPAEFSLMVGLDDVPKPLNRARLAELETLYANMKGEG